MRHTNNLRRAILAATSFILLFLFISCNDKDTKCCEGYTGNITNEQALKMVNKCNFISKDSIEIWTKKYEEYKKRLGKENDSITMVMDKMAAAFLKGNSVSFNSCIVKKLLCSEKSIGLRVLYGIGGDDRIHIILVGIQPDYSNLYVDAKEECCKGANYSAAKAAGDAPPGEGAGGPGGAEYGQMP
jgi:hypothetical protein